MAQVEENQVQADVALNSMALNNELLAADIPEVQDSDGPKRNSKQALIEKIVELSERDGIPLEYSNTKLKRMNKQQLSQLCADMIEQGIRKKMARTVGAPDDSDASIALGALRMLHDVCAVGVEKGANSVLDDYGYSIDGFSENLKEPNVSKAIDVCLEEIARENTELLEYVKSPYTRLMIAWGGAMAFSCRKVQKHVTHVESRQARAKSAVRVRGGRGAQNGKVHSSDPPAPILKTV